MKRKMLLLLVIFFSAMIILICMFGIPHGNYYPKQVFWLPDGFLNLQEVSENTNDVMKYVFFEEYISLIDMDGASVGGALVKDNSFIIEYHGEYYVNAEKYYKALEKAKPIAEQYNNIYALGDKVELRGIADGYLTANTVYTIIIAEIKMIDDETGVYEISFSTTPDIDDDKRGKIFDHFETENGEILKKFTIINNESVLVELSKEDKIRLIVLKSPDYDKCIRRVSVVQERVKF